VDIHISSKNCPEIGVWCAASHRHVVGALFFEDAVDGDTYRDILSHSTSLLNECDCWS